MAKKKDKTFPLLNTEEAEEIVKELGRALDVHRDWTRKFRTMLVCRTKPKASDLAKDSHKNTVFGQWYYGGANPKLRDHPNFMAVDKNSQRMHDAAHKLALLVRDGDSIKPAQYLSFIKNNDRFQTSVRKLLSEAWDFLRFTDPLTGVMTRTTMKPRLEDEQERVRRQGHPCAIGLMDLDHFKKVNDTHGHAAGDTVLQVVAGYVQEHLRRYDQVFRYGGEEFLLLLPNTTTTNAKRVLDRVRQGIKRQKIKIGKGKGKTIQVSASFGIAGLLPDGPVKTSMENSDKALYEAKNTGRNRVCVWKSPAAAK